MNESGPVGWLREEVERVVLSERKSTEATGGASPSLSRSLEPPGAQPRSQILGRGDGVSTVACYWDGPGELHEQEWDWTRHISNLTKAHSVEG
jgi:hypothetical protein